MDGVVKYANDTMASGHRASVKFLGLTSPGARATNESVGFASKRTEW